MKNAMQFIELKGPKKTLKISIEDKPALKMAMLVEVALGEGRVNETVKKYGYTREHYHKVKKCFDERGSATLYSQKPGPKQNNKRNENVTVQIIRHRFLDPDASSGVIAQKMNQEGFPISKRSVERTITEYGLQKKGFINLILKRKRPKRFQLQKQNEKPKA